MFHTIELQYELRAPDFDKHKSNLYLACEKTNSKGYRDNSQANQIKGNEIHKFHLLSDRGIDITLAHFTHNEFHPYFIILRINPKRFINGNDYISTTSAREANAIFAEIDYVLANLGITIKLYSFNVSRIDYCHDYNFYNKDMAKSYMELLKRAALLEGSNDSLQYGGVDNPNVIYDHYDSHTINVYNKGEWLSSKPYSCQINPYNYEGLIRFEVQCYKPKIRNIKAVFRLPDKSCKSYKRLVSEEISQSILNKHIKKTFREGDFYTIQTAKEKILSSRFRYGSKESMFELLDLTNSKCSLQNAKDEFRNRGHAPDYLNRSLNKFDEIGVSPVTIPDCWGIPYLPNPLKLINGQA